MGVGNARLALVAVAVAACRAPRAAEPMVSGTPGAGAEGVATVVVHLDRVEPAQDLAVGPSALYWVTTQGAWRKPHGGDPIRLPIDIGNDVYLIDLVTAGDDVIGVYGETELVRLGAGARATLAQATGFAGKPAVHGDEVYWIDGFPHDPAIVKRTALAGGPNATATVIRHPDVPNYAPADALATDGDRVFWGADTGLRAVAVGGGPIALVLDRPTTDLAVAGDLLFAITNDSTVDQAIRTVRAIARGGAVATIATEPWDARFIGRDADHVYWVAGGVVKRVPRTGGAAERVMTIVDPDGASSVAVGDGAVYWTAADVDRSAIWRRPLPGR